MNALRVLIDTNGYSNYLERYDPEKLTGAIERNRVIIYGFKIIRDELRAIPKEKKQGRIGYRNLLLNTYDQIVKDRSYRLTPIVEIIAKEYAAAYKGNISVDKLWEDFLIVACASLHELDILVSDDKHSMLSEHALEAYRIGNQKNEFEMPRFLSLNEFERLL